MTNETHSIIEGIVAILLIGRGIMSHFEHKKTSTDVKEIKFYINGNLEKKLEEAKEEGRQEILNKNKSL